MQRRAFLLLCSGRILAAAIPSTKVEEIERIVSTEMARQGIPGMSIAIVKGDEPIWTNGYGMADLENFVPARASTAFRTASIAKPITAVAALQLLEKGKLDLDTPVEQYLPAFPKKPWPITTRQLLSHLGGIRWYRDSAEMHNPRHYGSLSEAMKIFEEDPLVAEPGTKYTYSTYGFVMVGAVIESVSGVAYGDYVRQNIFEPAGMRRTRVDDVHALIQNRARGYVRYADGLLQNSPLADNSVKIPGGGLVSTSEDLVRFALAIPKLLKPESVATMWTPLSTRDGKPISYGLGWNVGTLQGSRQVWHSGGQSGTTSILRLLPDAKVAVAMMFNLESVQHQPFADQVVEAVLR